MKNEKKIMSLTIGIPAFNEEHNIGNLLDQILSQKQEGYHLEKIIVASDGSTDRTSDIAREYRKSGVVVFDGKDNNGQNFRQNEIISNTTSDILVLLNADISLANDMVISKLIHNIVKGNANLTAQWAIPLPPRTFIERILCAGFTLKYYVYLRHKHGNNIYTSVGHMRALSKEFYSKVVFPKDSVGEDQYLYLECVKHGLCYNYAHNAEAHFRLPTSFDDYKKYSKRIFQTQRKHVDILGRSLAEKERKLPLMLQVKGCLHSLKKHKAWCPLYIVLHIIMQIWALRQPISYAHAFEVSTSSKRL